MGCMNGLKVMVLNNSIQYSLINFFFVLEIKVTVFKLTVKLSGLYCSFPVV